MVLPWQIVAVGYIAAFFAVLALAQRAFPQLKRIEQPWAAILAVLLFLFLGGLVEPSLARFGISVHHDRDECADAPPGGRWEFHRASRTETLMVPGPDGWEPWCTRYLDRPGPG